MESWFRRKFQYQYSALADGEIRLLRLRRPFRSGNIDCYIQHFPHDRCPPYVAISYTWDSPFQAGSEAASTKVDTSQQNEITITLNGRRKTIQKNLFHFLQHAHHDIDAPGLLRPISAKVIEEERRLRYEAPDSYTLGHFWVDALCIDQSNIAERNSQVAKMKDIYGRSTKIIAWLGPADDTTDLAVDTIINIGNRFERLLSQRGWSWDRIGPSDAPQVETSQLDALRILRRRLWWSRAWIIQEISTPSQYPTTLWCGRRHFTWDQIVWTNSALLFTSVETELVYNVRVFVFERLRLLRKDPSQHQLLRLENLLRLSFPYDSTDPRDKVYSILGIVADGQVESILPDYSVPVQEVYKRIAVHVMNRDNNLEFLSFCNPGRRLQIPSWVPDWSVIKYCQEFTRPKIWMIASEYTYDASRKRTTRIQLSSNNQRLIVEGIEIDVILEASETRPRGTDLYEEDNIARLWAQFLFPDGVTKKIYKSGGTVLNAAGHIVCADIKWHSPWTDRASFSRGGSSPFPFISLLAGNEASRGVFHCSRETHHFTLGRKLIRTQGEYIGLCTEYVQPGDRVCILFGAQVPFILRPVREFWEVIGEAYVHGIMDGEALEEEREIKTFEFL